MAQSSTTTLSPASTGTANVTTNVTAVSAYPTSGSGGVATLPNGQIATDPYGNSPYNTTSHFKESGSLYTTPSVQGSYFSGANPCLIGVGGGAAGGPVGFSINIGRNDEGCQRRSDAAAWHALGLDRVAVARMCQDPDNKKAFEDSGFQCPIKPTLASATEPAQLAVAPVVVPPPKPVRLPGSPDWCDNPIGKNPAYIHYVCG
jgi:hypothetical protein